MKRDMDLIRTILLEIEKAEDREIPINSVSIGDFDRKTIRYHIDLLEDSGLAKVIKHTIQLGRTKQPTFINLRLSWEGHEFLDAARDDNVWAKAKVVLVKMSGLPFEVLQALLIDYVKDKAGL